MTASRNTFALDPSLIRELADFIRNDRDFPRRSAHEINLLVHERLQIQITPLSLLDKVTFQLEYYPTLRPHSFSSMLSQTTDSETRRKRILRILSVALALVEPIP